MRTDDQHPPEPLDEDTPVPEPELPPETWEDEDIDPDAEDRPAPKEDADLTTEKGAEAALEQFIGQPIP